MRYVRTCAEGYREAGCLGTNVLRSLAFWALRPRRTTRTVSLPGRAGRAAPERRGVRVKRTYAKEEARAIASSLDIDFAMSGFDLEQFRSGLNVEAEHGNAGPETNVTNDDPLMTGKIALAHLNEFPDYYTRLAKMEAEATSTAAGANQSSTPSDRRRPPPKSFLVIGLVGVAIVATCALCMLSCRGRCARRANTKHLAARSNGILARGKL